MAITTVKCLNYKGSLTERLDRIESKLAKKDRPVWVKVSWVLDVTGWTKEKLRQARDQNIVEFKKDPGGFAYDLNSIPAIFLKVKIEKS